MITFLNARPIRLIFCKNKVGINLRLEGFAKPEKRLNALTFY